jgi:PhzF family phenazine biosynthesis protein
MRLQQFQIDAFSERAFGGNPAAVVPLAAWLPDASMQAIAAENQLSETAFLVPEQDEGAYALRWFTPTTEVALCGHATLAAGHALWQELGETAPTLRFATRSGPLTLQRAEGLLWMDFPACPASEREPPEALTAGLGMQPPTVLAAEDWLVIVDNAETLRALSPDMRRLAELDRRGVIVSAPGEGEHHFLSRFFAPKFGIDEDPVTGSAHCTLAPYWGARLGLQRLRGYQASTRGGTVTCRCQGDRVHIGGQAVTFLRGEIEIPD